VVNSIQLRVYASETTDTTIPREPAAQVFKFHSDTRITIGRAFDNALLLDDELVSRYNAAIFRSSGGQYLIERMRDSAHVLVDGVPIEREIPLVHGCNLTIGKTMIQFLLSDEDLNVTRID
jgi:pSer/pThr/pTyr-binding forkhead associated (FHA) protein